ncbi:rCG27143 [Rattus norvegicus]|uniref:RCG27143 n=1 Tax=Rattus norvegicus TaxID=10116 RepID=A6HML2_RAT|nr:rCG27143 [Rattus norvegicus]
MGTFCSGYPKGEHSPKAASLSAVPQTLAPTCQDLALWKCLLKAVERTLPTRNSAVRTSPPSFRE